MSVALPDKEDQVMEAFRKIEKRFKNVVCKHRDFFVFVESHNVEIDAIERVFNNEINNASDTYSEIEVIDYWRRLVRVRFFEHLLEGKLENDESYLVKGIRRTMSRNEFV